MANTAVPPSEFTSHEPEPLSPDRNHLEPREDTHTGTQGGAVFFGWMVAIAMSVLLTGVLGSVTTGVGATLELTREQAEANAGTIGVLSGVAILVVLVAGYFAGGYVAARMARFSGGRQGFGVWVLGLAVAIVVAAVGVLFGSQYDLLERVSIPTIPVSADTVTLGGLIGLVTVLVGTAVAAYLGGRLGQRYHDRIDRTLADGTRPEPSAVESVRTSRL